MVNITDSKLNKRVMVFQIPEEMRKKLELIGKEEERTKAFLIRKAIEKFLEEWGEKNAN